MINNFYFLHQVSKMNFEEYEKEIRSVILSAISKSDDTTIFERVCDVFKSHFEKPATNITEIRKRGTKEKGNSFEVFCMMYLRAKDYEVWHISQLTKELREFLNLPSQDVGIDLIARIPIKKEENSKDKIENYFYFPVQVKYRKPTRDLQGRTVHRVGWKDISTFLSLVTRSGPNKFGWCKHILVTNASSVSWKGTKGKKDWTIAKVSFEKCDRFFWLKMCGVQKEEKVERVKIVYDDSDDEDDKVEKPKNTRDLREAWLNKNFK